MPQLYIRPSFHKDRLALQRGHPINHKKLCEILVGLQTDDTVAAQLRPEGRIPNCVKYALSSGYRAVFQRVDGSDILLALTVGTHDHVDSFLDAHRGWIFDPKTGRMRELRLATMDDSSVNTVPSVRSPAPAQAPPSRPLFEDFTAEMLQNLGVDSSAEARLRQITSANDFDLLTVLEHLATTAKSGSDLLMAYATGDNDTRTEILGLARKDRRLLPQIEAQHRAVLDQNSDEFLTFDDPTELEAVLEGKRFEAWQLFLHPDQRHLVTRLFDGPARIRGISGSGKTVVALHRAAHHARALKDDTGQRILLTTHNKALASGAARLLDTLCGAERERIQVTHLHNWCLDFITFRGLPRPRFAPDLRTEARHRALASVGRDAGSLGEYLWDEIDFLMGRFLHDERANYLATDRTGRGRPLTTAQRETVLAVYEAYMDALRALHAVDPADFVRIAYRLLRDGQATQFNYAAVVVDEVQDMSELALKVLHQLVGDRSNGLLLIGDGTQRIFTRGFSLRQVGIYVAGRGVVLRKNYRNTKQILEAAFPLISGDWEGEFQEAGVETASSAPVFSVREGVMPALVTCGTTADEDTFLVREVKYLLGTNAYTPRDICVMARTDAVRKRVLAALNGASIPSMHYRADDAEFGINPDRVRVSSLHSSKGHEYAAVFIPGMVDGVFPPRGASSDNDRQMERAVLYVGMTRARDILYLSYARKGQHGSNSPSSLLSAISPFCEALGYP